MRSGGENLEWKDWECCIKLTRPNYKELQFCAWKDVNDLRLQIIVFVNASELLVSLHRISQLDKTRRHVLELRAYLFWDTLGEVCACVLYLHNVKDINISARLCWGFEAEAEMTRGRGSAHSPISSSPGPAPGSGCHLSWHFWGNWRQPDHLQISNKRTTVGFLVSKNIHSACYEFYIPCSVQGCGVNSCPDKKL